MPLPNYQKSWILGPNNRVAYVSLNDVMASLFFSIKSFLVTNGYTIKYTCNGTTGPTSGSDHTDRLITKANCTTRGAAAGNAQSFLVVTDGNGADILFAYQGGTDDLFKIMYSPGGLYTPAGTANQQPTATDETPVVVNASIIGTNTLQDRVWHLWTTTDKKMFRCAVFKVGAHVYSFGVEQITSQVLAPASFVGPTIWGFGHINLVLSNGAGTPWNAVSGSYGTGNYVGGSARLHTSADANTALFGGGVVFNGTNLASFPFSTERPELQNTELLYPLLKGSNTVNFQGPVGTCIDWYFSYGGTSGGSVPAAGDPFGNLQWMTVGSAAIWPWDGTTGPFALQ
jgi:hypothetical protein